MPHVPVLANEIIRFFEPRSGRNFVDCTVGEGGHAEILLAHAAPDGIVLGIDRDRTILDRAEKNLERFGERIILVRDTYAHLAEIIATYELKNIHGILFDLGISSYHVEESGAGFSFRSDEPLDMRFNRESDDPTASEILKTWDEQQLQWLFTTFGEEQYAAAIARTIIDARKNGKILATSADLAGLVASVKRGGGATHPATQVFQALRIVVNKELEQLGDALPDAVKFLESGGRIAIISYHSLEDRLVKHFFINEEQEKRMKIITEKPIAPSPIEQKENPRSRSAKLRVAEKI